MKHSILIIPSFLLSSLTSAQGAVLVATDFTGSTTSGTTVSGISWSTDYASVFGTNTNTSTTITTPGAGTITGTNFTNADTGDYISAHINNSDGTYTNGTTLWTSDYTLAYNLTGSNALSLSNVTLTAFAKNNGGNAHGFAQNPIYVVSIFDSTGTNQLATATQTVAIPGSGTAGTLATFDLGNTILNAGNLGSQSGNLILRVTAQKTGTSFFSAYDNLSLNGTYGAVPEPSTYGLLGAGALATAALVRRRKRA